MNVGANYQRLLFLVLLTGIASRILRWSVGMPLWGDEVMLAVNFLQRDVGDITTPLFFGQVAPALFIYLQSIVITHVGNNELWLRLLPLLAGIAALIVFARFTREILNRPTALLACLLLAVSYYPIRYAAEFKPYSMDLLASIVVLWLGIRCLRSGQLRWTDWCYAALIPLMTFVSYPVVFVVGAALSVNTICLWRTGDRRRLGLVLITGVASAILFVCHYYLIIEPHRLANSELGSIWKDAFPPHGLFAALFWFVLQSTGKMMAYPNGGAGLGSILTVLLFAIGVWRWCRQGRWALLSMLLLPFAFNLIAAFFHAYPYGGSPRIAQHIVPAVLILSAVGIRWVLVRGFSRRRGSRWVTMMAIGLGLALAVGTTAHVFYKPYKSIGVLAVRDDVGKWRNQLQCQSIRVANTSITTPVNYRWYLDISGTVRYSALPHLPGQPPSPVCLLLFDEERYPRLRAELERRLGLLREGGYNDGFDDRHTAYIYGGTDFPHQVRMVVMSR